MKPIADESILYRSPMPDGVYCYSPGLLSLPGGRLAASFDLGGPLVSSLPGPKSDHGDFGLFNQCKVFLSDDHGARWRHAADLPMLHARLIHAGGRLYLLGHNGALTIAASDDHGEHWSAASQLDDSAVWHQAPCEVDFHRGRLYLTMEQRLPDRTWPGTAPVLLSAAVDSDLTRRENWTFSNALRFDENVNLPANAGIPFYPTGDQCPGEKDPRYSGDPCWLESHVLRIHDPRHQLHDPSGRSVLLYMRCHTGLANIAALAQGREDEDGGLHLSTLRTPAGAPFVFAPCPGGHMKFHITHDPAQKLYWLAASQSTDSMTRPALLPADRYNLPDNERHRLALYFSTNLFDWCFAGMIAMGATPRESRHYAALAIHGDDLLVLSRSGDAEARSAHNGNLITFHRIPRFRELVY